MLEQGSDQLFEAKGSRLRRLFEPGHEGVCDDEYVQDYCVIFGGSPDAASEHLEFVNNRMEKGCRFEAWCSDAQATDRVGTDPENLVKFVDRDGRIAVLRRIPQHAAMCSKMVR